MPTLRRVATSFFSDHQRSTSAESRDTTARDIRETTPGESLGKEATEDRGGAE